MDTHRYRIPSASALVAFESVARLGGVGRAATELGTSQSAISRHLKQLEGELGLPLVAKSGRGITLTSAGAAYFSAVSSALDALDSAGRAVRISLMELTIACSHEVSHLLLMPRFAQLRSALGGDVNIRILTCEYDATPDMVRAGADITFEYAARSPGARSARLLREEIVPVAAPEFMARHARHFHGPVSAWCELPRLALTKNNFGWATWEDWFEAQSVTPSTAPTAFFDNYVYALEAAATGDGLALGWRGFVDRYLDAGTLVPVSGDWLSCPSSLYARLSETGARKKQAAKCLQFLSRMTR